MLNYFELFKHLRTTMSLNEDRYRRLVTRRLFELLLLLSLHFSFFFSFGNASVLNDLEKLVF